jgi:hypothetical protein
MPPPRQQRQKSAQTNGQANAYSQRPAPVPPSAGKGATSTSRRRLSRGGRGEHAKDGVAGRERRASDHQEPAPSGTQLPESRITGPPENPLDFEERQYLWATKDKDSLRRNIRWQWHRTLQRLVTFLGPSALAIVVFFLTRKWGLAPQTAVKLSLACLASATVGVYSREWLNALSRKRQSARQRNKDDASRNGNDRSS